MDLLKIIGKNVEKLRKDRGLTQEDLGFESGLHRTYVSGVERGIRNPSAIALVRLAVALKAAPGDLFKGFERAEKERNRRK